MNGDHGGTVPGLAPAREAMLALLRRHVSNERVITAMAAVPREAFVPAALQPRAYDDRALPIGHGQTISQPLIVAMMLEAMQLHEEDRVLEVGTGSGYQAALLARLARSVTTVEIVQPLFEQARDILAVQAPSVDVRLAGDMLGAPERAPFDAIIVAAAAPHIPRSLLGQVAPGGRLVLPVGGRRQQHVVRVTNTPHGVELQRLGGCAFVPLVGREGWRDRDDAEASASSDST
jgi:protein-L-isoaspartate(D-aspartate) O-methyltransferase